MASSSEKIAIYNVANLKNTTDDAIANYLNSLKFKQSHFLGDVRSGLGCAAILLAAACFAWDYKLGFEATKLYTAIAVGVYAVINGALTLWISFVEKGVVYEGTAPSGETISISSAVKKYDPTYKLSIAVTDKAGKKSTQEVARPFASFFDESGYLVAPPLQEILASAVPAVGVCDPRRVKTESQRLLDANPELLDAYLASASGGAAAEGEGKK
ncbi:putative signal peptidase complex subunit 2 [Escovopsis weberi]|uniref:Signal peptidase complex subunit 2 n=1 Tax=Escovopsis weberi TaxID=150374 RepID=A0A0M8MY38_ESCWE|nr:putative signal peptidase complex subunit 2 [Escovopsis weberi]